MEGQEMVALEPMLQAELVVSRAPKAVIKEAQETADALIEVVNKTDGFVVIGKGKHLKIESWITLGRFYGLTARTKSDQFIQYGDVMGFEATADVVHVASGKIVGSATAMVLNDEERWSVRPKYEWQDGPNGRKKVQVGSERVPLHQLRSMAQTRACSKALASVLRWVVVLAGYAATPAEEMTGNEVPPDHSGNGNGHGSRPAEPQRRSVGTPISEAQDKRMWAIFKKSGKPTDEFKATLKALGFEHTNEVTRDKYEAICNWLEGKGPNPAPAAKPAATQAPAAAPTVAQTTDGPAEDIQEDDIPF